MTGLDRKNAEAIRSGQSAHDSASPPEDGGRQGYIVAQAKLLLAGDDSEIVPFYSQRDSVSSARGFDDPATDALADIDGSDYQLLQLVLAALRGDSSLAHTLAQTFEVGMTKLAEKMIEETLDAKQDD